MTEIIGVTGWKNSGKTTLVAALVREFTKNGLRVSTVKHAHHNIQLDHQGTDSFKHRAAGAMEVALVSDTRWALMHEVPSAGAAPTLDTILAKLAPCDLVLVEGYKTSRYPKIECIREQDASKEALWKSNKSIAAIATDAPVKDCGLPQFELDDVSGIAEFITQISGLRM